MKLFFTLCCALSLCVGSAQRFNKDVLVGKWRVSNAGAAPMVLIFADDSTGVKGVLRNWNDLSDFVYKTSFTYTVTDAPLDSLTGNPAIDNNLFLLIQNIKTITGTTEAQSCLLYIASKNSIGLVLRRGYITPYSRVN